MEVFAKDQFDEGEKGAERGTKGVRSHGISLCHVQNNPHGHFLSAILIREEFYLNTASILRIPGLVLCKS